MKRILFINTDGTTTELSEAPTMEQIHTMLNGHFEVVRVLGSKIMSVVGLFNVEAPTYSPMLVNDTGLVDGLPRNDVATVLYQRATRRRYSNEANPFRKSKEDFLKSIPEGMGHISLSEVVPGYDDDPYIAGPVIYFEGYTFNEFDNCWYGGRG